MRKRLVSSVLAFALAGGVAAGGGKNDAGGEQNTGGNTPVGTAAPAGTNAPASTVGAEKTETPAEPAKVDGGGTAAAVSAGDPSYPDAARIKGADIFVYHQSAEPRGKEDQKAFSEMYGCTIRETTVAWDQYYSKLISLIMAGDPPDVFDVNDEVLPMYAVREVAVPIDGMFDAASPYLDFEIMDGMRYKDKYYILQERGRVPVMIFYNETLFGKYGMETPMELYERGEWTIDKLYEVAAEFNEDTVGDGVIDQFGFVGTSVYEFFGANQLPLAAYDAHAGKFELTYGNDKQLDVLQDALNHIVNGDIQAFGWTAANLFPKGKLAMAGYEYWFADSLGAMEDKWNVAPYPVGKYGDADYKYVRPFGVGVAAGADNGYAGMAYTQYVYSRNAAQNAAGEGYWYEGSWAGARGDNLRKAVDKKSYFSLHIGIPNFRSVTDSINYAMIATGGRTVADLFNEQKSVLTQLIGDFNSTEQGWVEPKTFENPGALDFEDGSLGYLDLVIDPNVHQSVEGGKLRVTLDAMGWYPVFATNPEKVVVTGGNKSYHVTFDYEIVKAAGADPMFYTQVNPGAEGWTELHVAQGDKGRFDAFVSATSDNEGMSLYVCFNDGEEVLIDNFDIVLAE